MNNVTASFTFHDHEFADVPVINPGDWWGRTWLVEVGGSYTPLFVVVEADTIQDAIDEFSDSKYGFQIHVDDADLGDYPEDDRHYDGNGRVIDLDWVMVHGREIPRHSDEPPFPVKYHIDGGPAIDPAKFGRDEDKDAE